jgi:multiple sugar transport system ATP-binding protein
MTLADRIVVLNDTRVEQIGAPMELYNKPANIFVAGFIGSPKMNFIDAELLGRPDAVTIGIRPEHITLGHENGDIEGRISHIEHLGGETNVYLDCGDIGHISVRLFGEYEFEIDSTVAAKFNKDRAFKFDAAGNAVY